MSPLHPRAFAAGFAQAEMRMRKRWRRVLGDPSFRYSVEPRRSRE
jgi:hypothetical protein